MKVQAVIFDWAGTTVDFGCCGPVGALLKAFAETGIAVSEADARRPMGLLKRDHIAAVLALPSVAKTWLEVKGAPSGDDDIDEIHDAFVTLQHDSLPEYATVIPHVLDVVTQLRERSIRIGSTTGYTRAMLAPVASAAALQGYVPDASVTPDEVGKGRPAPFMILENLVRLNVWPLNSVVKVGDTPVDIEEGLTAGVWAVGVAGTGNAIGMPLADFMALSEDDRQQRLKHARQELAASGAHYIIDTMAELPGIIDVITAKP